MDKVAVDQKAKEYWSSYFKDYGESWTRDIPRRIKQAMRREANVKDVVGNLVPIAANVAESGLLSVEAGFKGKIDDQDAQILVTASFDSDGKMLDFVLNRVS